MDDHDLVKLQNLSVIGNDAETLIRTNGTFLLDSSLMSDAAGTAVTPGRRARSARRACCPQACCSVGAAEAAGPRVRPRC